MIIHDDCPEEMNGCQYYKNTRHKELLGKEELLEIAEEIFKLFVLVRQLSTEGPVHFEYIEEKIDRIKQGIPIILHHNLQRQLEEIKERYRARCKS